MALCNPCVPLTTAIQGGLHEGQEIVINGVPTGCSGFKVSFVCGSSFDCDDIALCFDVRFKPGNNHVIINHKSCKSWGKEEKPQSCFPFAENSPFEITILVKHSGFTVSVDGRNFVDFKHRIQCLQKITHLQVDGAVRLTSVQL